MTNFYCVPESCARVVWRERLPSRVRWRYPGEEWQEREADNFTLEDVPGELPNDTYVFWRVNVLVRPRFQPPENAVWIERSVRMRGTSSGGSPIPLGRPLFAQAGPLTTSGGEDRLYVPYDPELPVRWYTDFRGGQPLEWNFFDICLVPNSGANNCDNGTPPPTDCLFSIYLNGSVIYQETRSVCPEAELLPAGLSDEYKEVRIDKLSYLEGIEVLNYAKDILAVTNNFRADIPPNCLNIYNTRLTPNIIPLPSIQYLDAKFITQICSCPTCDPPVYEVICDCEPDCEECPPGTCAVICGDRVCCYDDNGIATAQIDINNYCGEI